MNDKELSSAQQQTKDTFGYKWQKRDTYESVGMQAELKRWLFEKYFDNEPANLSKLLEGGGKRILDAGCGGAMSSLLLFGDKVNENIFVGVDVSDAVHVAKQRFSEAGLQGTFVQADLNSIPTDLGGFDLIFSEGVLHHTDSVQEAIEALTRRLNPNGLMMFYVYAKKAPIREFTDDLIRGEIAHLGNDDAWDALIPLTKLGKTLGDLNIEIDIADDIPYLGIKKGRVNLQRLFYYKVFKAYYQPGFSVDEMNHINFDWFRPTNCYRHTPDEISTFCAKAGLDVERLHVEESGITVIARKSN